MSMVFRWAFRKQRERQFLKMVDLFGVDPEPFAIDPLKGF
jgi:hypothetical protein